MLVLRSQRNNQGDEQLETGQKLGKENQIQMEEARELITMLEGTGRKSEEMLRGGPRTALKEHFTQRKEEEAEKWTETKECRIT